MNTGVYKIENIINGKIYIGSTSRLGFTRRWYSHLKMLRKNKHYNQYLQASWNKHGENNFKFEIIERCLPNDCIFKEQYYFNTLHPKYNILKTAGSPLGYRHSVISKQKIGDASRGKNHPQYSGEHRFYNPTHGIFEGSIINFGKKYNLRKSLPYKLYQNILKKTHGWIYIGKTTTSIPKNLNKFYYNRIYNNRPIYSFYNKKYGIFTGTIPDFVKTHNLKQCRSTISVLIHKKRKMAWGWIFIGKGVYKFSKKIEKMYNNALKFNTYAHKTSNIIYSFVHPILGQYNITKPSFAKLFNLNYQCINHLESGKLKTYKEWIIKT